MYIGHGVTMSASMSPAHWMPVRRSSCSPTGSAEREAAHGDAAPSPLRSCSGSSDAASTEALSAAAVTNATEREGKLPRSRQCHRRHTHRQTRDVPTQNRFGSPEMEGDGRLRRRDVGLPITRQVSQAPPPPRVLAVPHPRTPPCSPEASPHLLQPDSSAPAEASSRSCSVLSSCWSSHSSSHDSSAERTPHSSHDTAEWVTWPRPAAEAKEEGDEAMGRVAASSPQCEWEGLQSPVSCHTTRAPTHPWRAERDRADSASVGEDIDEEICDDGTEPALVEVAPRPCTSSSCTPPESTTSTAPFPQTILIAPTAAPPPVIFPHSMIGSPHGIQLRTPRFAHRPDAPPAPQPLQPPPPPRKTAPPPVQFAPLASPPEMPLPSKDLGGTPVRGKRDNLERRSSMLQQPQSTQSSTTTNGLSARTYNSGGTPAATSPAFSAAVPFSSAEDLVTSSMSDTGAPASSGFEQQRGCVPPPPSHGASPSAVHAAHLLSPASLQARTPHPPLPPPPSLPPSTSPTLLAVGGSVKQRPPRFSVAGSSDRDRPERPSYLRLTSPCAASPSCGPRRPSASRHLLSPLSAFEPQDGSLTNSLPTFPLLTPRTPGAGGGGSTPTPHVPELDFSRISDGPIVRDGEVIDAPWWGSARNASCEGAMPSPYLSATALSSAGHRPHYGGGSNSSVNAYSGYDEDDDDSEDEFAEFHPDVRKARELAQLQQQQQRKAHHSRGHTPVDALAPRHVHRAAAVSSDAQGVPGVDSRSRSRRSSCSSDADYIVPGYNDTFARSRAGEAGKRDDLAAYYRTNQSRAAAAVAAAAAAGPSAYAGRSLRKDLSRGFLRGAGGRGGLHRGARAGASATSWVHAVRRFLSVAGTYLFRFAAIYLSSWLILRTRSAMAS